MAWYNKYRPQNFGDVVGQSLVKSVLQNAISKDRVKHAYLFSGPKGVGKTTLARIFANNLNNTEANPESTLDIVELDAASHTGVDDIRQLIESAKTQPIAGKYKIFIIDEVHMLSKSAMNALLKILEEPPEYLIFLLATTNAEKLIPTVLSRLTVLHLSNHTIGDIVSRLSHIADTEGLTINENALKLIAVRSGGSQRDAINLLETMAGYELEKYDENNTAELLGLLPHELLQKTSENLAGQGNIDLNLVKEIESKGVDGQGYLAQLLDFLLDKSLQGDRKFDHLILPLAEVLNLQLPLTGPLSALALVSVRLQNTGETVKKKPENLAFVGGEVQIPTVKEGGSVYQTSKPATAIIMPAAEKVADPVLEVSSQNTENGTTVVSPMNVTKPTSTVNTGVNYTQFVQQLPNQPDAPAVLKMLQRDISAELREQKLVLQNSNTVFQSALKSPAVQSWVADKFEAQFGFKPHILLEIRKKPLSDTVNEPTRIVSSTSTRSEVTPDSQKPAPVPSKIPENHDGVFYSVYNRLPKNMEEKGVKIKTGPLPGPAKDDADWDDHAKELFEFE